jgi:hypothetical protein
MVGKRLSPDEALAVLQLLKARFERNMHRHPGIEWATIEAKLQASPEKIWSLSEMERTGGEPDVVVLHGVPVFVDCTAESPKGRRSLCYDRIALDSRKEAKPASSAVEAAAAMGAELLTEAEYLALQSLGEFDLKTSSWVETPAEIRALGGALFGDRRYGRAFIFHNGAESYYAARGFRARLRI